MTSARLSTTPVGAEDIAQISDLKARYFYYLDNKLWERLPELFTPDAEFEGFAFAAGGTADFVDTVSRFLGDVRSAHEGFMPRFAHGDAADVVFGVWTMRDYLTWEPDSRVYKDISVPGMRGIHGYGYYEERYERADGVWRIAFSRLARTRIVPIVGPRPPQPDYSVTAPDHSWVV
jgi:hypothetical protein